MWWLVSILLASAIGLIVRLVSRKIVPDENILVYIDEFIGQAWSSVFIMELGVVGAEFGAPSLMLGSLVFIHFFIRNMYFAYANNLYDNPVAFVNGYYAAGRKVTISIFTVVGILGTQIAALIAGQFFAKFVWQFTDDAHVDAIGAECQSALSTSYSWQHAAFLEAFGVFVLVLVGLLTAQTQVQVLTVSATATAVVTLLSYASGQFMNGSIATAFSYRCQGHPDEWKFLVVYWLAPMVGIAAAWETWLGADRLKSIVQVKDKQA